MAKPLVQPISSEAGYEQALEWRERFQRVLNSRHELVEGTGPGAIEGIIDNYRQHVEALSRMIEEYEDAQRRGRDQTARETSADEAGAQRSDTARESLPIIDDPVGELEEAALTDGLTGLASRRMLNSALQTKFAEMNRYRWRFGILLLDIDHFKAVNDTHGHGAGDDVLKVVANTLLNNVRPFDIAGRWGGGEFLVLVANVSEEQLDRIADRFRVLIGRSAVPVGSDRVHVTVSIGATIALPGDDNGSLIQRADKLLCESKKAGPNRVSTDRTARDRSLAG